MKINTLIIENYKNYNGLNHFDFNVTDNERIILVGGDNGSGKTTIQEAIRLCLYGRFMEGNLMPDGEYKEYISGCFNKIAKTAGEDRMSFKLELTMDDEYPNFDLTVTRNFQIEKDKQPKESLQLTQCDQEVEIIDVEFWEDYIRSIIPPAASKYFFFDGEKVKDVIASSNADDYIRQAVESISGLSVLRSLKNDLSELKKKNIKTHISPSVKKEIENLESKISDFETLLENNNTNILALDEILLAKTNEKRKIEEDVRRRMGSRDEEIRSIQKSISEMESEARELKTELHTFYKDVLPFAICKEPLIQLKESIETERKRQVSKEAFELLNQEFETKKEELRNDLSKFLRHDVDIRILLETIQKRLALSSVDSNPKTVPYLSEEQMLGIHQKFNDVLDSNKFIAKVKRLEDLQMRLAKRRRQQKQIGKNDINGDFSKAIDRIRDQMTRLEIQIEEKNAERDVIVQNIQITNEKILEIERQQVLETFFHEKSILLDELVSRIDERINSNVLDCVIRLEKHINSMYRRIMHKEDMVERIVFSRDGFKIGLIGFDGEYLDRKKLSEGEKSILALSVQYGLSQISDRKLPMIVDSPLGKLDSFHVDRVLTDFYPNAGNQVIILSHDREITSKLRDQISSWVASSYLLSLNDKNKISKGYFSEATS